MVSAMLFWSVFGGFFRCSDVLLKVLYLFGVAECSVTIEIFSDLQQRIRGTHFDLDVVWEILLSARSAR